MEPESNVRSRRITDPLALRALAHPIRRQLHGLVGREGALTAAAAARQLGISHALASHHLHQLAKYGFVEQAAASDARERPWRVVSTSYEVAADAPDGVAAAGVLHRYEAERAATELARWQRERSPGASEWDPLVGSRSGLLYLTPDELRQLLADWTALIQPLADRRPIGHHDDRPADAEPVSITLVTVPVPRTEHGG